MDDPRREREPESLPTVDQNNGSANEPAPEPAEQAQPLPSAEAAPRVSQAQSGGQAVQPQPEAAVPEAEHEQTEPILGQREWRRLNRREVLKLTPLVLAGAFIVPKLREPVLQAALRASDWSSGLLFSRARLAPTYAASAVVPLEKFPYNGYDVLEPDLDLDSWSLVVEGKAQRPGEYRLEQIRLLPKITQNVRHVCVEGWDVIGNFAGARIADFLQSIGADPHARFLEVECADDYYESIDMASAVHPQSLLCYEMYGKPLDRGHGAPLRLHLPTKLGYKQAKYVTTLRVTDVLTAGRRGYWEDQGYGWFAGM